MAEDDNGSQNSGDERKVINIRLNGRRRGGEKLPRVDLPGRLALLGVVAALLLWGAASSFYQVNPEETGVVLRFGKYVGLAQPGLNFRLPFGIDRVYMVKTGRNYKEEFGFRTASTTGARTVYKPDAFDDESLTLTGDLNFSDIEWIVQFQIIDPFKFLFNIKDPRAAIRDVSEAVVRRVVGNSNVTQVLTTDRALLAADIERETQAVLKNYDIGVRIVTIKFQDVNPPAPVKTAFNEVNEAEQQRESLILNAREEYNREVPKARGVARSQILEAEGYAVERINRAEGERTRFLALLEEYRKAPEVTRTRLYLETMEQILPRIREIYVMDKEGSGALPLLPLRVQERAAASGKEVSP